MSSPVPPSSSRTTYIKSYSTPFKRHLAFYDLDEDGVIWFQESLRGSLSLGLNFPAALFMACGIQSLYGNRRPWFMGPLRGVEIEKVTNERFMLENFGSSGPGPRDSVGEGGVTRKLLTDHAKNMGRGMFDRFHILGVWALSADQRGLMTKEDITLCQEGMLLSSLAERRQDRENVIPFLRGGPISVSGHAWFVEKLFGVRVYQEIDKEKRK